MNRWHNRSIRFKATTVIILVAMPLLGSIIYGVTGYTQRELWKREVLAAENLNSITSGLVSDAMMEGKKHSIQSTIEDLGKNVGGQFDSIAIYDDQATLTSFATGFSGGRNLDKSIYEVDISDPNCWVCHQLAPEERPRMTIISIEGEDVLRSVVPLYNEPRCQTCHGTGLEVLGDSIVDLSIRSFEETSQTTTLGLGASLVGAITLLFLILFQFLRRVILSPLEKLGEASQIMAEGNLHQRVQVQSKDEIGQLGNAFNTMASQVSDLVQTLEERVAERTLSLEERSRYLESSAEVSRAIASITDPEQLTNQVVNLIKERFDLYYVGLFIVDEENDWALLRAGTGEAGRIMLEDNHRLKVGSGMIGWSIANARARIALDVGDDAVRFENPVLPDTRSEGALPLRSRGRVLGALSIQSTRQAAFTPEIINALQTMADQIAIALDNAELISQSEASLEAERKAYGQLSQEEWLELLQRKSIPKYISDAPGHVHVLPSDEQEDKIESLQSAPKLEEEGMVAIIPVKVRGHIIGGIKLRKEEKTGIWTKHQLELAEALAEEISEALENARLFDQSQRRAAQEQIIGEITSTIGTFTDTEAILRATVNEIGKKISGASVIFELDPQEEERS